MNQVKRPLSDFQEKSGLAIYLYIRNEPSHTIYFEVGVGGTHYVVYIKVRALDLAKDFNLG